MSKEIAQTVGGKKVIWLMAILAAFAVFATLGTQWRTTKATVTQASYTLAGPYVGSPDCTNAAPALVAVGDSIHYCVTATADATVVNPLQVTITLPVGITINDVQQFQFGGPQPSGCTTGSNVTVCTFNGLTGTSTWQLFVGGVVTAAFTAPAGGGSATCDGIAPQVLLDDPSNGFACATDNTAAITAFNFENQFVKSDSGDPVANTGGSFNYILTYTHPTGAGDIAIGGMTITDNVNGPPAGSTVTNLAIGGTAAADVTCVPAAGALNLATPVMVTCTNTAGAISSAETVVITITVQVPNNPVGSIITWNNTGSISATFNGVTFTDSDTIQTSQDAATADVCEGINNLLGLTPNSNCGPVIRHFDMDDSQTEQESRNSQGILITDPNQIDDWDNSTGSNHAVCLFTEQRELQNVIDNWEIITTVGTATVNNKMTFWSVFNVVDDAGIPGQIIVPCVRWSSAQTGNQTIRYFFDVDHFGPSVSYDGVNGVQPLIKEWNTIDSTKIVSVTGNVGATLSANTGELDNWIVGTNANNCVRDDNKSASDINCLDYPNVDGTTVSVGGSLVTTGDNQGKIIASGKSFIDYTLGAHVNYSGPVDGARQTYTLGGTCGSVRVEDPASGVAHVLTNPGDSVVVLSSDKGVGFQVVPTNDGGTTTLAANADCRPGDSTIVTITTRENAQLRSDLDTAPDEIITITWTAAPPTNKQPILAWAGQRVILEHYWGLADGTCGLVPAGAGYEPHVQYSKQAQGPGGFTGDLISSFDDITYIDGENIIVEVFGVQPTDANANCISRVVYESQDPGEVDVASFAIGAGDDGIFNPHSLGNDAISQQVDYLIYYMKLESVTIAGVDGARAGHNAGSFTPANPWDASKDKASVDANVSADVLARVRVKGWFTSANPSGREAGKDSNGGGLPAGRWVMPDDWAVLAGGALAAANRPNYDIMVNPASGYSCTRAVLNGPAACSSANPLSGLPGGSGVPSTQAHANVAGPFSLLDGPLSTDGVAPLVGGGIRQTWLPDRVVDMWDAPMPPALVSIGLSGSGYLKLLSAAGAGATVDGGADKLGIYSANPFYATHIPAEPWLSQYNSDGSGYLWNSWGTGANSGLYDFWLDAAARGSAIYSAGKKDACKTSPTATDAACIGATTDTKVATGGFTSLKLYSDNHGEAMAYVNGDAGLSMDECVSAAKDDIIQVSGVYCPKDALVGKSTLSASADYPDKRKHYPLAAATPLAVNWKWGGIKSVTVVDDPIAQFKYVVFHVKDRDGFCSIPTVQLSATQYTYATPTSTPTVETFPLYVRTSTSQPQTTNLIVKVVISPSSTSTVTLAQAGIRYAGPAVPGGIVDGSTVYQATTTNTGYPFVVSLGTYSLHPVLGEQVDFMIDAGEGRIVLVSDGSAPGILGQDATANTFDTNDPNNAGIVKTKVEDGECQAWVKVSNSLLGIVNVLVTAHDPEGTVTFDKIIDLQGTHSYTLTFRWSLVTWVGADNIPVSDALKGTGANDAGNDIFDQVTAVYGWEQATQNWLAFFPSGVNVPGANDLTALKKGQAYWIAIKAPGPVTWTIATNVD